MPNPSHLLVDTDALIQVFIAKQHHIFMKLIGHCGVRPAVVPEVESEVRWHRKFKDAFEDRFQKTVGSGRLFVLDDEAVRRLFRERACPPSALDVQMAALDQTCQAYSRHVGEGEAYTHAVAATFGLPVLSNDGKAIETLIGHGKQAACPTLRFFDLLVFARGCGWIDDAGGEEARTCLDGQGEHLPPPFRSKDSFATNWRAFACRLSSDVSHPAPPLTPRSTLFLEVSKEPLRP